MQKPLLSSKPYCELTEGFMLPRMAEAQAPKEGKSLQYVPANTESAVPASSPAAFAFFA